MDSSVMENVFRALGLTKEFQEKFESEVHRQVRAATEAKINVTECVSALQLQTSAKALQTTATAMVGVLQSSKAGEAVVWKYPMPQCCENYHKFRDCRHFRGLAAAERKKTVDRLELCSGCLTMGHGTSARDCPYASDMGEWCRIQTCSGAHHWLLHVGPEAAIRKERRETSREHNRQPDAQKRVEHCGVVDQAQEVIGALAREEDEGPVQLVTQWINTMTGRPCLMFWDTGSQVTLTTHKLAQALKLTPLPGYLLDLTGVGSEQKTRSTVRYKVPLVDTGGRIVSVQAYGIESITSPLKAVDPALMRPLFPVAPPGGIIGAEGEVDLLIGQDHLRLFPVEKRRVGDAALHGSRFGTGWIASGRPLGGAAGQRGTAVSALVTAGWSGKAESKEDTGETTGKAYNPPVKEQKKNNEEREKAVANRMAAGPVAEIGKSPSWSVPPVHIERGIFQSSDFLLAEALGTNIPRRCTSCIGCKECTFRSDSLTFKENQEYQVILGGLKLDVNKRKWTASYPFCIPATELMDNYNQVYSHTLRQEKRLTKQGRTEEFNKQFYDTVGRGVFKEIEPEEMADWKGPVNYITMVEAFKEGPHSTTPLRICMNSSLRQLRPVSKSLNDCLMKGPSALVDLFTVTLSIREHKYVLAKDVSKFYQRVNADPLAQHLRRVMWRGGDEEEDMKVYITATVNFGDKPAGCIAIAAARETADRFGGGHPEAAWFLKYRTYVDDATAGGNTMERLRELSTEMEAVAKEGGFEFKETLMSGDKTKDGEPLTRFSD
jgi:hypothetical protein